MVGYLLVIVSASERVPNLWLGTSSVCKARWLRSFTTCIMAPSYTTDASYRSIDL